MALIFAGSASAVKRAEKPSHSKIARIENDGIAAISQPAAKPRFRANQLYIQRNVESGNDRKTSAASNAVAASLGAFIRSQARLKP